MTAPEPSPEPGQGYAGAETGDPGAVAAAESPEWRDLAVPVRPAIPHVPPAILHLVMTRPAWEAPEPEAEAG